MAKTAAERDALWKGRKGAFGAVGQMSPDYYVVDGVVPRSKLPATLAGIGDISKKYNLPIANVFHAGDGNLHPLVMFDSNKPGDTEKTLKAGEEIIQLCADAGGALSGEHGIGMEKRDMMCFIFDEGDLGIMRDVREAFDTHGLCNPGKVLPTPGRCGETRIRTGGTAKDMYVKPDLGEAWYLFRQGDYSYDVIPSKARARKLLLKILFSSRNKLPATNFHSAKPVFRLIILSSRRFI